MQKLKLINGNEIPILGLGTWNSKPGEVYNIVKKAIQTGYRHIDCARAYENQEEIGQAIRECLEEGVVTRDELWITSKLWNNMHKPEHVKGALEETLTQLQLDYLDLYLIHWPVAHKVDVKFPKDHTELVSLKEIPLSSTWQAMIELEKLGLTKNIGVSNFSISKIQSIVAETGVKPAMNQIEMHPYLQQKELKTFCDGEGILLTAYCPLGSPNRPANRQLASDPVLLENKKLIDLAKQKGVSTAQLIISWAVNRNTIVIPKTVKENRLLENLGSADIKLTKEDMEVFDSIGETFRYIKGDFWCIEGSDYTLEELWS